MRRPSFMFTVLPLGIAMYLPFCAAEVRIAPLPVDGPPAILWQDPGDVTARDLFYGSWGAEHAPNPGDRFTLVERKHTGINPGLTALDSRGREWSIKQALSGEPGEAPVEVVLSRILSAVGYPQPPVYYLPSFTLADDWGTHAEPGGRFRLKVKALKDRGIWSWQQNPFVGTRPYQGLLVILLMFNSSDLKNSNNNLYEHRAPNGIELWFMPRDLGSALGTTGRLAPRKNDVEAFEASGFITGVRDGFVEFEYRGWHQELVQRRIAPGDVVWASNLLARLSGDQWHDAFRAGGYQRAVAERFIAEIHRRIAAGQQLAADATATR